MPTKRKTIRHRSKTNKTRTTKKFKKTKPKLMSSEKAFLKKYVKKGGQSAYGRVLRRRWWIGRLSK